MRLALTCFVLALSSSVFGQSNEDLQKQIQELKDGQIAIQRQLQEIKQLLQGRQAAPAAEAMPARPIDVSKEIGRGNRTAKVAIIEYSDYQCPFCGRYDRETYPQIASNYIDTGKVQYFFRDLPLSIHPNAQKAAEAARCAGEQGKFWEMHDRLFANQQALDASSLPQHAAALKLNDAKFNDCLATGRFQPAILKTSNEANSAGISGTPSFLIGYVQPDSTVRVTKRLIGARPYADFKAAIDEVLASQPQ